MCYCHSTSQLPSYSHPIFLLHSHLWTVRVRGDENMVKVGMVYMLLWIVSSLHIILFRPHDSCHVTSCLTSQNITNRSLVRPHLHCYGIKQMLFFHIMSLHSLLYFTVQHEVSTSIFFTLFTSFYCICMIFQAVSYEEIRIHLYAVCAVSLTAEATLRSQAEYHCVQRM